MSQGRATMIAVASGKGGTGKTKIAAHLVRIRVQNRAARGFRRHSMIASMKAATAGRTSLRGADARDPVFRDHQPRSCRI